jgi:hypothetical protein
MGLYGDNERLLSPGEQALIRRVFLSAPLPSLGTIRIRDGLSPTGTAFTDADYSIMVGARLYNGDLADLEPSTLVHEMTHVWQYYQGYHVRLKLLPAHLVFSITNSDGYLYTYDLGDSWDSFGLEGQAQMVEDWYSNDRMSTVGSRFVYIDKVLRSGNPLTRDLTLEELRKWPGLVKVREIDMTRPDPVGSSAPFVSALEQLLEPRFRPGDPAAVERVKRLEEYFEKTAHPKQLLGRLEARLPDDKAARAFHHNLHPTTIARLLKILRDRR